MRSQTLVLFALISLILLNSALSNESINRYSNVKSVGANGKGKNVDTSVNGQQNTQVYVGTASSDDKVTGNVRDQTKSQVTSQKVSNGGNSISSTTNTNGNNAVNVGISNKDYDLNVAIGVAVEAEVEVGVQIDHRGEAHVEVEVAVDAEASVDVDIEGKHGNSYKAHTEVELTVDTDVSTHVENTWNGGKDIDVDVDIDIIADVNIQLELSSDSSDEMEQPSWIWSKTRGQLPLWTQTRR